MILNRAIASALLATTAVANAFSTQGSLVGLSKSSSTNLRAADTDAILPSFDTKEEYTSYLKGAGQLPKGFAVGTASGNFVSVEAPAMGPLPIKATVIHLTEGPTDSWAAVFTSNKVCYIFDGIGVLERHLVLACTIFYLIQL